MRQAGVAGLEGWLRTAWMPYTERIPQDDRETFIAEVAQHVQARCSTAADGAILLPMVNMEVEADKPELRRKVHPEGPRSGLRTLPGTSALAALQDVVWQGVGPVMLRRPAIRLRQLGFGGY